MEGAPATIENSGVDSVSAQSHQLPAQSDVNGDGGTIGGGFTEEGDRNSGGNRWPKQETLALIRIRSEMDAAFRDSNLKAPLWDEVSRKLLELGFHRSAKKCREKFENVYKYHRRTKEGRTSKSDKIYRFSDELQALESNNRTTFPSPLPISVKPPPAYNATGSDQNNVSPISVAAPAVPPPPVVNHKRTFPFSISQPNMSGSTNSASSSDTLDNEPIQKKKKWEDFFEGLMKEMIGKQEELQMKFLESLDRRERDRVAKEEAWRAQEIEKMNQEHDRLIKERSNVAAKDAAIVAILQKLIRKSFDAVPVTGIDGREKTTAASQQHIHQAPPSLAYPPSFPPQAEVQPSTAPQLVAKDPELRDDESLQSPSPSRWPKAEIDALIGLRSQLDVKYQENVPKGPLWEEISVGMRNLGYNRHAKRCKEKWENINKYYKKIKESSKKRPDDSKTCPYFDKLDAIYKEKSTPIVALPEQQWPPAVTMVLQKAPPPQQCPNTNVTETKNGSSSPGFSLKPEQQQLPSVVDQETPHRPPVDVENQGSEDFDDFDDDDDHDDDGDKEDLNGGYEIVGSKIYTMAGI